MTLGDAFGGLAPPRDDVMWTRCRAGHEGPHSRSIVFPDAEFFNSNETPFTVYEWDRYMDTSEAYCPGQDIISREIDLEGAWERAETRLYTEILRSGDPDSQCVIDFGSQIGWYSAIAAAHSYEVVAIDVSVENCELAQYNIAAASMSAQHQRPFTIVCGTIDEASPSVGIVTARCVKIDIEGAEQWAVDMLQASISAGSIDYLLIEISPVFNDSYRSIIEGLKAAGYVACVIPRQAEFVDDPLRWTLQQAPIDDVNIFLAGLLQADVLFAREQI